MIKESNIEAYAACRGYEKQKKVCPYDSGTNRTEMKRLFAEIEARNEEARANIWRAIQGGLV
jgi:flavoprotein